VSATTGGDLPFITFNHPMLEGNELAYIQEAVEGGQISMSGKFSEQVRELLREAHGARDVLLTTSCTDALEMTAMLLNLQPGDTVIVPSFTFVSSALAYVREGARIKYADIEPETLALDPKSVAALMDDTVRAVVTVHYAGIGGKIDELAEVLAPWPNVELIEDNAHGLFGTYKGVPLGSFGRFSTLSFHETKNFVCGEGGALVMNHPTDVERAHILFDKGTNRQQFMLGQVDKYSWVDLGSSFGMTDILAAYLLGQLECRDIILKKRRTAFDRYEEILAPHAEDLGFTTPVIPEYCEAAYHMFYVLLPDRATRDKALADMRNDGIRATFHYVPLHSSQGGRRFAAEPTECPVTDDISGRLLRLPFHNGLSENTLRRVTDSFLRSVRS
jgi:dTDP-4-amino-4,6-dideoxygalactose transaminase